MTLIIIALLALAFCLVVAVAAGLELLRLRSDRLERDRAANLASAAAEVEARDIRTNVAPKGTWLS